jgi:hypothetical protein
MPLLPLQGSSVSGMYVCIFLSLIHKTLNNYDINANLINCILNNIKIIITKTGCTHYNNSNLMQVRFALYLYTRRMIQHCIIAKQICFINILHTITRNVIGVSVTL